MKFSSKIFSSNNEMKFFQTLPWGSYLVFLGGVFFLFAMIGFVSSLLGPGKMGYLSIVMACGFSGLTGALYAHSFMRDKRTLFLVIPLHIWLSVGIPLNDGTSFIADSAREYLQFHALGILFLLVFSYVLFIRFIGKQGLQHFRLKTEIDLAKQLHSILVPVINYKNETFEVYGISKPVGEVGGDLADIYYHGAGIVTITVADVSGHGVSAGVFMGMFKSALRTSLSHGDRTGESFTLVNRILHELKERRMFLTAASLKISGDEIVYSVAGHLPILIFRKDKNTVEELTIKQIPVGVKKEFVFAEETTTFQEGDIVIMLTDGVTETFSKQKQQFGIEEVKRLIQDNYEESAATIVEKITEEVEKFGNPSDDLTIVAIRHNS